MNGIYHVPCPDGVDYDDHVKHLRRTFQNARGSVEQVEIDILDNRKGREHLPARLIMSSVKETGETTRYEGFTAQGTGVVQLLDTDTDFGRDARPMKCTFNLASNDVHVETLDVFTS